MKKIVLITSALILSGGMISKSWAECTASRVGWRTVCTSSVIDTSGSPASCGEGCTYTYNNGTLTIIADNENFENPQIDDKFFAKSYRENDTFVDVNNNPIVIQNVVIDGFTKFSGDVFHYMRTNISGKDGTLVLDDANWNAFDKDTLTGNIIWRGRSYGGFNYITIDGNLIIEDTAYTTRDAGPLYLGTNGKIFCKTDMEKCQNLLTSAGATEEIIATMQAFPEGCNTLTLSAKCASCGENFRLNDGECDRIRYTPADAAKVLKDTDNELIMTFKVNR